MKKLMLWITTLFLLCFASSCLAALEPPVLSTSTDGLDITLDWPSVPEATGYKLYYVPVASYTGPDSVSSIDLNASTTFNYTLWEGASFYIAVKAYNDLESSPYSNVEVLNIELPPAAPRLSVSTSGLDLSLSWDSVPAATGYTLSYAPSPYSGPASIITTDVGVDTSFQAVLWDGAAFFAAVQAYNDQGVSDYSNIAQFTIQESTSTRSSSLPDTGQVHSYTDRFGEDSDYIINPPSFTNNGNGTVTDNVTELMWQREHDETTYSWYKATGTMHSTENINGATDVCGDLKLAGYMDWRLPTVNELMLIADSSNKQPAIDTSFFPNTSSSYWSSTTYATDYGQSWYVSFDYGGIDESYMNRLYYVRCVRGEESVSTFSVNGDGTVTDNATSLTWQRGGATKRSWEEAIRYCEELPLAGYVDWRLPNKNELVSLINFNDYNPAIDEVFNNNGNGGYWSSTTYGAIEYGYNFYDAYAWRVWFSYGGGINKSGNKIYGDGVRCVRSSQ